MELLWKVRTATFQVLSSTIIYRGDILTPKYRHLALQPMDEDVFRDPQRGSLVESPRWVASQNVLRPERTTGKHLRALSYSYTTPAMRFGEQVSSLIGLEVRMVGRVD